MKVPVLLPKVFNYPFTYEFESKMPLKMGDIVEVPFGKKKEIGVVWDKIQPSEKIFKLRNIEKKLDNFKINKNCKSIIRWHHFPSTLAPEKEGP